MILYFYCMLRLFEWILSDNDIVPIGIDEFNYRAWHFISSFRDHVIQIYVEQKPVENQWRVMVLEEFLPTALLYQVTNTEI